MEIPPWYVLTGGPCTGKTTLINEFKDRGYSVFPESARTVIAARLAEGKTIQEVIADPLALERDIVAHQLELVTQASTDELVFFDRGVPDNIAYLRKFNLAIGEEFTHAIDTVKYRKVFLLDMIEFAQDGERYESPEEAKLLHEEIKRAYAELGYEIVTVPVMPVPGRADFVLARID